MVDCIANLIRRHFGGVAGKSGKEKHEVLLKKFKPIPVNDHGLDMDISVRGKADPIEPAAGCRNLILAADMFLQDMALKVDGFRRQLNFSRHHVFECITTMEQADGERGTGSQPRAGRQVAVMMDFDSLVNLHVTEGFTD